MTDKEKLEAIKAEIEKTINSYEEIVKCGGENADIIEGKIVALKSVLIQFLKLPEEPVSVWHNVQYPYDETKPALIVAIDHTLHLWKGKFDTDKMCKAFRLSTGTDRNNKPLSIVSKWAYIDDLLKL